MSAPSPQSVPEPRAVAVIPARGGSRRIPRKNLALFEGRPALTRVIDTVRDSGVFHAIRVSTDDAEVADTARAAGAEVVARPATLADDHTPLMPVVQHAIETEGEAALVCLVLATAVLLKPERLAAAHAALLADPTLDYVIGLRRFDSPPQRALVRDGDGRVAMMDPTTFNTRSQDLTPLYHDAGQFSFGRRGAWETGKPSFTARTLGVELPRWEAIDIDEPDDLAFARLLFRATAGV
ncbi:pseudaminic acid cytidylyltransferase [Roseospira marina]|uniref:Pseudaminic acid cytidylyltransferase n=1 Tax=Roseospira marina TaxID=140057 RepID=A0A5M6ICT4_9PROT|nr:pseudaminic acid cytidylyltransferase [Roseospira marina]KAA5606046.1 pseudaminic acid cytidylyltransferase [Roseospira marina]MBB4313093.1 N-acylneuraminate cytidylyltransferase [Roseospira marina]MBB5086166.1 N-acylneuraminate cytidylyltransferase [Roseospira marina]